MINKNSIYNNSIICDMGCGEGGFEQFFRDSKSISSLYKKDLQNKWCI